MNNLEEKLITEIKAMFCELIKEEDERFLPGIFGEKRLDCRLKCLRNNNDCQICNRVV